MLMTVLRGDLAIKQSRALVKAFKKMKDYILENCDLIGQREILQLSMETANNRIEINKINSDMISLEKQISDVAEGLKDVVTKSELANMMNSFVSDDDERVFLCGASSKDAGARITSFIKKIIRKPGYQIMGIITAGKRDWKLLHNRIEGAKDTEHLDISGNGQNLFCCLPISQSQHLILRFFQHQFFQTKDVRKDNFNASCC